MEMSIEDMDRDLRRFEISRIDLQCQIDALSVSIDRLRNDRSALAGRMALIQADRNIPNEILAMIFDKCEPPQIQSIPSSTDAFRISRVCRRWRQVAMNCPSLWRTILIARKQKLETVSLYLARSRNLPLDILFNIRRSGDYFPEWLETRKTVKLLTSHAHRWQRFSVVASHISDMIQVLNSLEFIATPLLRYFYLTCEPVGSEASIPRIFSGGSPLLSAVRLRGVGLHWPSFSFPRLTKLDMQLLLVGPNSIEFSNMVAASPSLQHLRIAGTPGIGIQRGITIPIPSLLSLVIDNMRPRYEIWSICAFLSTPALESLTIAGGNFLQYQHITRIVEHHSMGLPRYPRLKSLHLYNTNFRPLVMKNDFMYALPMLSSLALHNDMANTNTFLALLEAQAQTVIADDSVEIMCPNLRSISLTRGRCNEELLRDMIYARLSIGVPMEDLNWCTPGYVMKLYGKNSFYVRRN